MSEAEKRVIPLVDLKPQYRTIKDEIDGAIRDVFEQCDFILGPQVNSFEEAFSEYVGAKHAVGTSSGTSALMIALKALGVGPGDEVLTTPLTFTATAEAICHVGARPVFVDVEPSTFCMDPSNVETAITARTKAVIPVHLYGNACDMDSIMAIARRHSLSVVEDAAQAHGATYHGKMLGTFGDVGCFSFYPGKNLGAYGDAGAVVTDQRDLAERMRALSNHGRIKKYEHFEVGYGERLDTLQAAILNVKLRHLPIWIQRRRTIAGRYDQLLDAMGVVRMTPTMGCLPSYHIYAVAVPDRDKVLSYLVEHGVMAGVHYPIPLHLQDAYSYLGYRMGDLPISERKAARELSLPLCPEMSEDAVDYVVECLAKATTR